MGDARRARRCINGRRLMTALPVVLLSSLVVTWAFGWLGRYALLPVLAWLVLGPLLLARRPVERVVVRYLLRFRRPSGRNAERLVWLASCCADLAGAAASRLDWYVLEDLRPNAFAAGHHSIAITTGLLRRSDAGQLTAEELLAVALHEVGHHATGGVRHGLVLWWLTSPWWNVHRLALRVAGWLPFSRVSIRLMPLIVTVAVWRIASDGAVASQAVAEIVLLTATCFATVVQPLIDAAVNRRSEQAADEYVATLGERSALAGARQHLETEP